MKIILTDSGLGGLSICAKVVKKIKSTSTINDIEIIYVNAVPRTQDGFNVIDSVDKQIKLFDNFLNNISNLYEPDAVYVACNSLSALLPKTTSILTNKTSGIINIGVESIVNSFNKYKNSKIVILGAETTIKENIYFNKLVDRGIPKNKIISQSCPGLANTISNDPIGIDVSLLIEKYLSIALKNVNELEDKILVYLGCTHYGYRTELFENYLDNVDVDYEIINPNLEFSKRIINSLQCGNSNSNNIPKVRFITHYPIPQNELNTLSKYLNDISPETVKGFQNYIIEDNLY